MTAMKHLLVQKRWFDTEESRTDDDEKNEETPNKSKKSVIQSFVGSRITCKRTHYQ